MYFALCTPLLYRSLRTCDNPVTANCNCVKFLFGCCFKQQTNTAECGRMIGYDRNLAGNVSLGGTAEANGAIAVAFHRCHHCHGLHVRHVDLAANRRKAGFT